MTENYYIHYTEIMKEIHNFSTLKLSFKTNKNNPKKEIIEIY